MDVSLSGLVAQRQRLNTISGNIANVSTTRGPDGKREAFRRRLVTFEERNLSTKGDAAVGVASKVELSDAEPRKLHQPGHPDADAQGYVAYPNIDLVTEFVNAMEASRAYEANLTAVELTKEMATGSLRILA